MTHFDPQIEKLPYRNIALDYAVPPPINTAEHPGSYAVVLHDNEIEEILCGMYGRYGLALKCIPLKPRETRPSLALWDGIELGMCSLVQNLIALDGFSPRVYGLVTVNDTHAAQVTDYIKKTNPKPRIDELMHLFKQLGIEMRKGNYDFVPNKGNWRDGLFVDFSGLYMEAESFGDLVAHVRQLATIKKGVQTNSAYQAVEELGIRGDRPATRELPARISDIPRGHVLDLGCNLGHFLRLVDQLPGSVRVVGVEKDPEVAQLARTINILLGHWNVDVVTAKLPEDANLLPDLNYSLVICLSAIKYMGDADAVPWLSSLSPSLWVEGHGDVEAAHYLSALDRNYPSVERLPDATDNMQRAQFLCRGGGRT